MFCVMFCTVVAIRLVYNVRCLHESHVNKIIIIIIIIHRVPYQNLAREREKNTRRRFADRCRFHSDSDAAEHVTAAD